MYEDCAEDRVWKTTDSEHLWVMDKLILSRKLGYTCGPTGLDVPAPGNYIVRPCVNMLGLGLGTSERYLVDDTTALPLGYFWCEKFQGRHLSIDYYYGNPVLSVEGIKDPKTFTKWSKWFKVSNTIPFPSILNGFEKYEWINCEFIDGNLIEVHLRRNEDFENDIEIFIPVWEGEEINVPENMKYIKYPDLHGRKGAYVK